ncbi:Fpg/Nei family DNA glycosylase [Granulicella tundricola]|uniref:DNA-(apurinic or apyrimidinic site) lyase n=1 Tax=Granulicella tundricola (strain ATCC BAA-1859 / DSM 23138 / MP5ACTX9) TaxID=1198114 RepID=E8X3K1_GRATM|nr:DNA-formamidopyrimidine glycosylase family protein [Granulicella tundricola]ADW68192.1 DNA-(apurinic or apyrimidinic site) lyase [Granulicella tundricola MP5ACTX9]
MPEGDTIYRSARALGKALEGQIITAFDTGLATLASVNDDKPLVGRTVDKVESRGKWLLIHFSGDLILVTHMLMSGSWHLYRTGEKWWMGRNRMRVALSTEGWQAVAFNVPIAEFHTARSLERSSQVPKLGPDVLAEGFTVEQGVARLREYGQQHPDAEIAVVLLNQRVLAGLGNVYKSEVAFAAGVNPFRAMSTITDQEMDIMVDRSHKWLKVNVLDGAGDGIVTYSGNRRTTNSGNREDRLWVYGRQGQECRRCGALVQMRKQGEQARSTYWCPACQPWVPTATQSSAAPVGKMLKLIGPRRKVGC